MEPSTSEPKTPTRKNRVFEKAHCNGSPKLKETLRKKCREKLQERRLHQFNLGRFGLEDPPSSDVQNSILDIVRTELMLMTAKDAVVDWDDEDIENSQLTEEEAHLLEQEMIEEQEQWLIEEYLRMQNEEDAAALSEGVICPICLKCYMEEALNIAKCKNCGFHLPLQGKSLEQLGKLLEDAANRHSAICTLVPGFTAFPENGNVTLCMMCQDCSTLDVII